MEILIKTMWTQEGAVGSGKGDISRKSRVEPKLPGTNRAHHTSAPYPALGPLVTFI